MVKIVEIDKKEVVVEFTKEEFTDCERDLFFLEELEKEDKELAETEIIKHEDEVVLYGGLPKIYVDENGQEFQRNENEDLYLVRYYF